MPNWKKVIISGSDAELNSLTTDNNTTVGGDLIGTQASTTEDFSILEKFLANPASENGEQADVRIVNNLAGANKWATITLTDCYESDRTTAVTDLGDNPFDGTSAFKQLYQNTAGDPLVIQIDLPHTITWSAWVGIIFGNVSWRTKSVKIETFRNGAWQTECNLTNQPSHIVSRKVANNDSNGVTKIKYTLDDLQNTDNHYIRILSLFNFDYRTGAHSDGGVHYIDKYKNSEHYSNIVPATDSTYDLGSNTKRYANVYADTFNGGTPLTVNGSGTANTITRFQGATTVEDSKITSSDTQTIIEHDSANNTIFIVSGSNGELMTVSDVENGGAGMLLSVNDNSGIPLFEVSGSGDLIAERLVYDDTQDFILSYNSASGLITFVSTSAVAGDAADGYIGDSQSHTAGGTLDMNGNAIDNVSTLTIQGDIVHDTDTDTKITFGTDTIGIDAGGVTFVDFTETTADNITFSPNSSDINLTYKTPTNANFVKIDAGTDTMGIGGPAEATSNGSTLKITGNLNVTTTITASSEIRSTTWLSAGSGVRHYNDTHTNMTFGSDQITLSAGGFQGIKLTTSEVIHNENGVGIDFRMESNLDDNMFLLDASADRIHIGGDSVGQHTGIFNVSGSVNLDGGLNVNGNQNATADMRVASSGNAHMLFVSGGANRVAIGHSDPQYTLDVNGSLEATSMYVDTSIFHTGDTDTKITFDNNQMFMYVGNKSIISAATSIVTINGEGNDMDFRVEGNTEGNLIYANAGTDRVGIGTNTPSYLFDVDGVARATTLYVDATIAHEGDTNNKISFANEQMILSNDNTGDSQVFIHDKGVVINDNNVSPKDFVVHGNSSNLIAASGSLDRVYIKGKNDLLDKTLNVQGEVTASDIYIDEWGSVSASLANAGGTLPNVGPGAGDYGSTLNGTKIDEITLDDQGRVTNITTGTTGDITGVTAGTNLNGGGTSGNLTLNLETAVTDVRLYAGAGTSTKASISFSETNGSNYGWYPNGFLYKTAAAEVRFTFDGTDQMIHDTDGVQITSDFAFGVGVAPSTTNGRIDASNDIVAFSSSDIRWKENIKPIENALDKVSQIGGYEFDWKELSEDERETQHGNVGHDVGVIAQEIEKVLPEVVTTRDNGFMGVKYEKIVPLLIESIKELKAEIDELKRRL